MLDIEYKGGNSVVLSTKKATVVVDPKVSIMGLKDISVKDSVELLTEARFGTETGTATLLLDGPGEYGVASFDIKGIAAQRHLDTEDQPKTSTMYRIEVEGIRVGLIGNIYEKLTEDQYEELGLLDVLIVPVGGSGYTLDPVAAAAIARAAEPKAVIPVHYAESGVNYEVPQLELEEFIKVLGAPVEDAGAKFKIKSVGALPATMSVVKISRS